MVQRESPSSGRKLLVCRKCAYRTDVLRPSCPECGGDMIAASSEE